MNFLMLRSSQAAATEQRSVQERPVEANYALDASMTEDPLSQNSGPADPISQRDGYDEKHLHATSSNSKLNSKIKQDHLDVGEGEGCIAIPYGELPKEWNEAADICAFRSLDRCFVFPGEQVRVLACLSSCKQDTEIITPFKVAAVMSRNGIGQKTRQQNAKTEKEVNGVTGGMGACLQGKERNQNCENLPKENIDSHKDVSSGESLLRMENHRKQTEKLLQRFKSSHFFVRIAQSDEQIWSKRKPFEEYQESSNTLMKEYCLDTDIGRIARKKACLNAAVDHGVFDAHDLGGVARNVVKCCSLSNGDIAVLLHVNVSVEFLRDPVLEILQFEKYQEVNSSSHNQEDLIYPHKDTSGDLLKWLLPLDNSVSPSARSLSPPPMTSSTSIRSTSVKPTLSGSSGSQLFSFSNFRSYSMSSLPPTSMPPQPVTDVNSRSGIELEEWNQFSFTKPSNSENSNSDGLLSFRGVQLERERFSVHCGLEGIYVPGRRWRKKVEIIHPIKIDSFVADCNTNDLLCVRIKNVTPAHIPDTVVYVDSIAILFDKASNGGPPLSIPIACIESGNDHCLPNLALRRGEEHSFILKPVASARKTSNDYAETSNQSSQLLVRSATSSLHWSANIERKHDALLEDEYAILVSCRCNHTESKLFFKQPTSWKPRISRDLMVTVASEISGQFLGSDRSVSELPVQVLTLQASNLTSEDLTLTVLAPASLTSQPSVVSLNSSPYTWSTLVDYAEQTRRVSGDDLGIAQQRNLESEEQRQNGDVQSQSADRQATSTSDVLPSCTHLWLQSRVPLGCVPSQSKATIKLELLPLTDGIITLDSLQIDVKEKGFTYIPKQLLKINATSSISTGII